jgi:GMT-like protein
VPTFEYSPAIETFPMLFELSRPLDDLAAMLLNDFAGQRLRMRDIYLRHSVGKPYIESNYKRVLASLEAGGKVMADPPAEKRRKMKGEVTFADDVLVSFPKGGLL